MSVDKRPSPLNIINLLNIPPDNRTSEDIENIVKATSHLKFFADLNANEESSRTHSECFKYITTKIYEENEYVCRKGDPGTAFYFILKGSVRVLTPSEVPVKENDDNEITKIVRKKTDIEEKPQKVTLAETCINFSPEPEEKEVAVLYVGNSFGEMALMNDRPRYFSVQCTEPTILGVLEKNDYHTIAKAQEKLLNEKIDFLRNLEAFKH